MPVVSAGDLRMTYKAPVREEGLRAAVGSLFQTPHLGRR